MRAHIADRRFAQCDIRPRGRAARTPARSAASVPRWPPARLKPYNPEETLEIGVEELGMASIIAMSAASTAPTAPAPADFDNDFVTAESPEPGEPGPDESAAEKGEGSNQAAPLAQSALF